jgi:hypothetical protein
VRERKKREMRDRFYAINAPFMILKLN